ncbi:MAG: hypothetical protein IJB69_03785 [Clostridia bacterium]|nr:hypothetical protein [Clostridia bacterium]
MKNGKRFMVLVCSLVCCLLLFVCSPSAFAWEKHLYLRDMNRGICKTLQGHVTVRVVFVDTGISSWTEEDKAAQLDKIRQAQVYLLLEGEKFNQLLSFENVCFTVASDADPYDEYDAFLQDCLLKNTELYAHARKHAGMENVLSVFCMAGSGRAMAYADREGSMSESLIVYSEHGAMQICHEMLHLFGANDLYFPQEYADAAEKWLPGSLMLTTNEDSVIDPLTAYTIGWTDGPDENALGFLQDTRHVDEKALEEALKKELFTGSGVIKAENSTYTGDLVNGQREGYGREEWTDGTVYTGEYHNGLMHGKGMCVWPGGTVYSGEYVNGKRTGKGTLTWADGTSYTGEFLDGEMHGSGKLIWPDGSVYEGEFMNGQRHGQGILTYASGQITEGRWELGEYVN